MPYENMIIPLMNFVKEIGGDFHQINLLNTGIGILFFLYVILVLQMSVSLKIQTFSYKLRKAKKLILQAILTNYRNFKY
jgi:hypothetical protein